SCSALVADVASTRSPPSSFTRAAHSGSQARTRSAACAGSVNTVSAAAASAARVLWFIVGSFAKISRQSVVVRAVRAEAHLVLKEELVVDETLARAVLRELQAHPRELARAVVEHQAVLARAVVGGRQGRGVDAVVGRARVEPLGAQADAPARHELVDSLQVPARLHDAVGTGAAGAAHVVDEAAVSRAAQVFALQLEARPRG